MKKSLTWVVALAATSIGAPRLASGQAALADSRPDAVACRDSATTGLYRRCALWIDGNRVRRGSDGEVAGRPGFFQPTAMTRLVAGDSALWYASEYEKRERQSIVVTTIGAALMAGGVAMLDTHKCVESTFTSCADHDRRDVTALSLLLGGGGVALLGGVFHYVAGRSQMKAVWWYNERFSR